MKTKLIYFSPTGTTKRVVREIARGIGGQYSEIDLTLSENREKEISISEDELAIIGAPVYGGRIPKVAREVLEKNLNGGKFCIVVAVYGNRAYDNALAELKYVANKKDLLVIAATAAIGEHSYSKEVAKGRPDKLDLAKLFAFGEHIKQRVSQKEYKEVVVPGEVPKTKANISSNYTIATDACTLCGLCAKSCPMGAIIKDKPNSDAINEKCIMCCKCIKICPENARVPKKDISSFVNKLKTEIAKDRKEIETFI